MSPEKNISSHLSTAFATLREFTAGDAGSLNVLASPHISNVNFSNRWSMNPTKESITATWATSSLRFITTSNACLISFGEGTKYKSFRGGNKTLIWVIYEIDEDRYHQVDAVTTNGVTIEEALRSSIHQQGIQIQLGNERKQRLIEFFVAEWGVEVEITAIHLLGDVIFLLL
jgi:hypothetical protein